MNLADVMRLESKRAADAKEWERRIAALEARIAVLEGKKVVPRETLSLSKAG